MQKWEYLNLVCFTSTGTLKVGQVFENGVELRNLKVKELSVILNSYGAQGWELVSHESSSFIFKRPVT
jgi:hypothetical protein